MSPRFPIFASSSEARTATLQSLLIAAIVITGLYVAREVLIPINFQPTGGGKAAITGDFVIAADEVNPLIRALRENGIEVTAIHSHMLNEQPRLFFVHFWANDDAAKLAKGLQAALEKIAVTRS